MRGKVNVWRLSASLSGSMLTCTHTLSEDHMEVMHAEVARNSEFVAFCGVNSFTLCVVEAARGELSIKSDWFEKRGHL